ncbi:MAG: hypothetical protein OXF64_03165, partial [bacterium]|nr:hypothetical protein [bacterium]
MHRQRLHRPYDIKLFTAVLAVVIASSGLLAAPASAQSGGESQSVLVVDPSAAITFTGSGWGHGVGMSQWAGLARAQAGQSAREILGFYYEDTELVENYGRPLTGP